MSDLIDRQAAIDALWKIKDERDSVYYTSAIYISIDAIKQLPSVQPKKGKLKTADYCTELWGASSICGVCGCSWQIDEDGADHYCPNCGATMVQEVEE